MILMKLRNCYQNTVILTDFQQNAASLAREIEQILAEVFHWFSHSAHREYNIYILITAYNLYELCKCSLWRRVSVKFFVDYFILTVFLQYTMRLDIFRISWKRFQLDHASEKLFHPPGLNVAYHLHKNNDEAEGSNTCHHQNEFLMVDQVLLFFKFYCLR